MCITSIGSSGMEILYPIGVSNIKLFKDSSLSIFCCVCLLFCQLPAKAQSEPLIQKCRIKSISSTLDRSTVRIPAPFMWNKKFGVFKLREHEINCKLGHFEALVQTTSFYSNTTATIFSVNNDGEEETRVENLSGLTARGYLRLGSQYYHPAEYCLYALSATDLTAYVCNPQCDEKRPCIQKCCGLAQSWDISLQTCRDNYIMTKPPFWKPAFFTQDGPECMVKISEFERLRLHMHITEGLPNCYPKERRVFSRRKLKNVVTERFWVLSNGTVTMKDHHGNLKIITHSYYCIDSVMEDYTASMWMNNSDTEQIVLACEGEFASKVIKKTIPLRYAAILLVAAGFLLFTTIIFILLWKKHNIYNWTIFCEVLAMLFMIFFVGIAHTFAREPDSEDYGSTYCVYIGATAHFFYLSTFFWLAMINFELWWTFRVLKPTRYKSSGWFRFTIYQFFGWGIPLVIVIVGLTLDSYFGMQNNDIDCTSIIVPNYGQLNCYLSKGAQGPYLYYPIGVLLGGNVIFFVITVMTVNGYRKSTQAVIRGRSTNNTKPLTVFAKLFIVMGVSWIFEVVSWAIHSKNSTSQSQPKSKVPWYWVIFDLVILLQAIAIFFMFVCKRQVLTHLWNQYPPLKPFLAPFTRLPCCGLIPSEPGTTVRRHTGHNSTLKLPSSENLTAQV